MRKLLLAFIVVCFAHYAEHIVQAYQVYVLNMPLHKAGGILGKFYPWLVHSEWLHWGYAALMFWGLWYFRDDWSGTARSAWTVACWIQTWHFFEHCLLLSQAISGRNLFHAPQPISVIQFLGFFHGSAETGFGGLLKMSHFGVCTCQGAAAGTVHKWSPLLLFVRRVEVHLMYTTAVMVPMVLAMRRARRSKGAEDQTPALALAV